MRVGPCAKSGSARDASASRAMVNRIEFADFMRPSTTEVFGFNWGKIERHEFIFSRAGDLGRFAVVEQGHRSLSGLAADQAGGMRLGHHRLFVRAVPGPMDLACRDPLKVALLAMESLVLDEEPYFPFQDVIDLLGLVNVGRGMVAGRPRGDHQAALVAVALARNHRPLALASGPDALALRHAFTLYMQRHFPPPFLPASQVNIAPLKLSTNGRPRA